MSTIDELDRLVTLITEKAKDLEFLTGLNGFIDAYSNNRRIEGSSEGQEDCQIAQEGNEIDAEDRESRDEFGWMLYDRHTFISKKEGEEGLEKESKRNWYFGKLSDLCEFVINEAPKDCEEAKTIATAIERAKNELLEAVKGIKNR